MSTYGVFLKLAPLSVRGNKEKIAQEVGAKIGIDSIIPSGADSDCYWVFLKPWEIGSLQASSLEEAWDKAEDRFGLSYPDIMVIPL